MRDVIEIPESWKTQLLEIKKTFPNAVIAGGCMRDWFIFRTRGIKDIDIFLPMTTDKEITDYLNQGEIQIRSKTKNYGNLSNDDINAVFSTSIKIDELPVEFIAVDVTLDRVLERFDFGICQIMYDGDKISYTEQFLEDINKCQFTLVRADNQDQFDRSKRRFTRLTENKYPGYTFNPGKFTEFVSAV